MKDGNPLSTCRLSAGAPDKRIIAGIMLRFRPIAPKPATAAGSGSADPLPQKMNGRKTRGRPKRKYTRTKKSNIINRDDIDRTGTMTLQLLPEIPNRREGSDPSVNRADEREREGEKPSSVLENRSTVGLFTSDQSDPTLMESSVTVESVTDVCSLGVGLGNTDDERMRNLDLDTCPGFVSDGLNRVMWINPAYRKMTRVGEGLKVGLVVKGELPVELPAFACRVRVESSTWRKQKGSSCQVLPCDVWRMDFGGLAWRMDLNASLTLGRNSIMEYVYN